MVIGTAVAVEIAAVVINISETSYNAAQKLHVEAEREDTSI